MSKTIHIDLFNSASVDNAVKELREYAKWVQSKAQQLAKELADYGLQQVEIGYAGALYDGIKDVNVTVEKRDENTYAIVASGSTVLILEFGSGVVYGSGHPQASQFGYGPGTYPGQTHVPDPGYWWFTDANGTRQYSVGNVPSMVMYLTGMDLEREVERVAKEVFST